MARIIIHGFMSYIIYIGSKPPLPAGRNRRILMASFPANPR